MSQAMYDPQMQAIDRRRQMAMMLMRQAGQGNFSTPASVYGSIAQSAAGALGSYMADRQSNRLDETRRAEMQDFMAQAMGGQGGAAPQQAMPSAPQNAAMPPAQSGGGDYLTRLVADESGGNPTARNPRSSATGATQFIDSTWLQFAQANPDRFQGMSRDQILAARNDPNLSREGADWYRRENLSALSGQGLPANDGTAALAHRFGPAGAAGLLRADPNAPIAGVVGEGVMRANPDLNGRTVGDVVGRYASRFGGGSAPDATPAAGVQQPPAPQMPRNSWGPALAAMQSQNPYIRQMAPILGQMGQRDNTPRPTVNMVGPQGPGVYERQADGSVRMIGGIPRETPQPTETERARARYIELVQRQDSLTPGERIELEGVARAAFGSDNVQVGPNGIAFLPAQRPGMNPAAGAAGSTVPAQDAGQSGGMAAPMNDAVAGAAPAPTQRPPQTVQLPGGRTAQYMPAEQPAAQPPQTMAAAMLENANGLRQAELALERAIARPQSFGFWRGVQNAVPGVNAIDRMDPEGVETRAIVANLGSLVIHDRSGAAVSASEFPRLRPFIPAIGDPPEVVQAKLRDFAREYRAVLADMNQAFGPASGYRELAPVTEALRPRQGQQQPGPGGNGTAEPPPRVIQYDAQGRRMR